MEKLILLGARQNGYSVKANKWFLSFGGLFIIFLAARQIWLNEGPDDTGLVIGWSIIILLGLFQIFYGFAGFSEKSKYAMRLKVNDSFVEYKSSFYEARLAGNLSNDGEQLKLFTINEYDL